MQKRSKKRGKIKVRRKKDNLRQKITKKYLQKDKNKDFKKDKNKKLKKTILK